jgi:hypothetical protein
LLQKIADIEGKGLELPEDLNLIHTVTQGGTAGVRYVRAGSTAPGMVNITLLQNGKVTRYIPVAAGSATHVRWPSWTNSGRGQRLRRRRR